jgi:glycine cleavage system aminomethyltransferase T/glycine/D-amino acid oxidase-like deaminating enzyme
MSVTGRRLDGARQGAEVPAWPVPERVCVIGGGIAGVSCAYHLVKAGVKDVVLVEKGELTSGSTHHAAGLVTQFNPSPTMMRFRRYSVELYRELGVFETVGSLRIASSPESWLELRRGVSRAHGIGLDAELVGPEEVRRLMPAASPESLFGAVWMPGDGFVDPHIATYALATAARELGAEIRTETRVTGIDLSAERQVRAVLTDAGPIDADTVVNAAGMWAPQIAAMAGAFACSIPVDHQHIALHAVEGHELSRETPCFRDTDNLVYGKAESGGVLFGGYEPNPVSRWHDGVPWEHGSRMLPPDHARFQQLMAGAVRRFPFLDGAGVTALVCHPDAMTPDGNPLLGPMPGVRGLWLAAGLSLNGFGGAGGLGKALAELVTTGAAEVDVQPYRPWRFGGPYRDPDFAAASAREVYKYYYRQRYPYDASESGRPKRLSPLHGRLQELGAVFGTKNGWERADYFRPGEPWRRAGEDQRAFGWARPPYHDRVAIEHAAMRERVGIIDMTSFGKLEVSGADALPLLERVCDNRIDKPVGSVVYTQLLDDPGGIVGDVTVTRLADDRFRVVTGAGAVDSDRGFLELNGEAAVEDVTDGLAVIGIWGPDAREALSAVTWDDVSHEAFPFRTAKTLDIGGAPVLAQRITYVGELGYELYLSREWAVQVWDELMRASSPEPVGYTALDSLRIEKGYRYFGADMTSSDTPFEAGVGFCVAKGKRPDLDRSPAQRLRTLVVGGDEYLTVYGGEAVHLGGEVIGRVRSAAYGFTVQRNVALARLPSSLDEGAEVEVDVLGELVPAIVSADALYDPEDVRVRS